MSGSGERSSFDAPGGAGSRPPASTLPRLAFASNGSALAFAALLASLLLLPLVASVVGWLARDRAYVSAPSTGLVAVFSDVHHIVFEEQGDVDIAFVGSSLLHTAIDAPFLGDELARQLGHPVTVRVLGFTFAGDDLRYALVKDLLARRRVRLLVIVPTLPWGLPREEPHVLASHWIDLLYHRELWSGLPLGLQAAYVGEAILGGPRRLLSAVRRDRPPAVPPGQLGSVLWRRGLDDAPFVELAPTPPLLSASQLIHHWGEPASGITSLQHPIGPLERRAATLVAQLLRDAGTRLVALNLPYVRSDDTLVEAADWSELLGRDTPLVGVAPSRLFAGLSDAELARLYADRAVAVAPRTPGAAPAATGHWNVNGSRFFTRAIAPALAELYARARP